jgi:hypothetical protein
MARVTSTTLRAIVRKDPEYIVRAEMQAGGAPIQFCLLALCGGIVAFAVAALYRRVRERDFHAPLLGLTPVERATLLTSLQQDRCSDTRKMALALGRAAETTSELAPAAPDARGDEASPAERFDGARLDR